MFYLVSLLVFILDQTLKILVHRFMYPNQSIPILKGILHLTYVQNKGAAFGVFSGWRGLLVLIGFIVIIVIIYINKRLKKGDFIQIPLAFILGGSLGNLIDRLFRSYVVDYLDFRFWPVFNLADIMINLGVFLVVLKILFERKKQERD